MRKQLFNSVSMDILDFHGLLMQIDWATCIAPIRHSSTIGSPNIHCNKGDLCIFPCFFRLQKLDGKVKVRQWRTLQEILGGQVPKARAF